MAAARAGRKFVFKLENCGAPGRAFFVAATRIYKDDVSLRLDDVA